MRILINCSNLRIGGGVQVAHSFLFEMRTNRDHFFTVVLSSTLQKQIQPDEFPDNFTFINYTITPSLIKALSGIDFFLSRTEREQKIERVFTIFGPSYWRPQSMHICGFAKSQYIFKDSPFFKQLSRKQFVTVKLKEFFHIKSLIRQADLFITETLIVSEKLRELIGDKPIYTVTNTYNQVFDKLDDWDFSIVLPPMECVTLLTISANYPHKNLVIIPKIIDLLLSKHKDFRFRFVLTMGKGDLTGLETRHLNHIIFLGYVKINQCPSLYQQTDIMFLPSLLECFSASYPEAMKMGIPVLTSDLPFAHGICGEAASYANPLDPQDIADKIVELGTNTAFKEKLVQLGYAQLQEYDTAFSRAEKYLKIIVNQ